MTAFGICITAMGPVPPTSSWLALRELGFSIVRFTPELQTLFPQPGVQALEKCDAFIEGMRSAGLKIYLNPVNVPAWASGGVPAYIAGVEGTWWWNDPLNPDPGQIHLWGSDPRFAEADRKRARIPGVPYDETPLPPRPWALDPPHIDPKFFVMVGNTLGSRYAEDVDLWGVGNEWDIDLFYPPIRFDGVNMAGGPDVVRDWMFPEVVLPFTRAVRSAVSLFRTAKIVGPEAASAGMLSRCMDAERHHGEQCYDVLSHHTYAWGEWPDDSYRRIGDFWSTLRPTRNGRPDLYSEIDGPFVTNDTSVTSIVDWTHAVLSRADEDVAGIFYLSAGKFFAGDWDHGNTTLNPTGEAMRQLIGRVNGRRRAAGR